MSAYPYLPLFTADFIADTTHLTAEETGCYVMLLFVAWQSPGCRLPDNDRKLATWARVDAATWQRIKPEVMAFWTLQDGHWHQKRLGREHARSCELKEKQRANAMRRWHKEGDATAMPRHSGGNANGMPLSLSPGKSPTQKGSKGDVLGKGMRARAPKTWRGH